MSARDLITKLRSHINDERFSVPAFSFSCIDRMATSATVDIVNGVFRTAVLNGSSEAVELNISLDQTEYDEIGRLVSYIQSTFPKVYDIAPAADMESEHSSADLERVTLVSCLRQSVTLRTHRFSDAELLSILNQAAQRHNPSYTPDTIPVNEHQMVLHLARAEAMRVQSTNAAKRRGLSGDADTFLRLAESFEEAHRQDFRRIGRALPSPAGDEGIDTRGEVVMSEISRPSLRTGFMVPSSGNVPPKPPIFYTPEGNDIEDFGVHLRWERSRLPSDQFFNMELWRDTFPDVRRSKDNERWPTTSCLVWRARGGRGGSGTQFEREGIGTVDKVNNLVGGFFDGYVLAAAGATEQEQDVSLEPESRYYWRLYLFDESGEWVASDVVSATTKRARAEFSRDPSVPALDVTSGTRAGGTTVTVKGTNFTTANNPKIFFAGIEGVSLSVVNSTTITVDTPSVSDRAPSLADVMLLSSTGLRDVYPGAWTWDAP